MKYKANTKPILRKSKGNVKGIQRKYEAIHTPNQANTKYKWNSKGMRRNTVRGGTSVGGGVNPVWRNSDFQDPPKSTPPPRSARSDCNLGKYLVTNLVINLVIILVDPRFARRRNEPGILAPSNTQIRRRAWLGHLES